VKKPRAFHTAGIDEDFCVCIPQKFTDDKFSPNLRGKLGLGEAKYGKMGRCGSCLRYFWDWGTNCNILQSSCNGNPAVLK